MGPVAAPGPQQRLDVLAQRVEPRAVQRQQGSPVVGRSHADGIGRVRRASSRSGSRAGQEPTADALPMLVRVPPAWRNW